MNSTNESSRCERCGEGCGKCGCGSGVRIYPDGINELDQCGYDLKEVHKNVDVHVLKCRKCGNVEIEWFRNKDTVDVFDNCL